MVTATKKAKILPLGTRAVERQIEPGDEGRCPGCDMQIKFEAKKKNRKAVCNIYEGKTWARVELWHGPCYVKHGYPWGRYLDRKKFGNRTITSRG